MEYRFKEIRENLDLKQHEIAEKINVSRGVYASIEAESDNIKLSKLNDYCNYFDCSMDYVNKLTNDFSSKDIIKINKIDKVLMAQRLEIIKEEKKLESKDIAKELGIAASTYSGYKSIRKNNLMQTLLLKHLASKYGYSMDWIVGRSNQKHIKK